MLIFFWTWSKIIWDCTVEKLMPTFSAISADTRSVWPWSWPLYSNTQVGSRICTWGNIRQNIYISTMDKSLMVCIILQHTLGTISWQQGNLYPSFMLLSVPNTVHQNSSDVDNMLHTQLCFLPRQLFIYMWYVPDHGVLGFAYFIEIIWLIFELPGTFLCSSWPFLLSYYGQIMG